MESKKVLIVAVYEAYVPEDMDLDEIYEKAEDEVRNNFEDFRLSVDYPDAAQSDPLFDLSDVHVGTEMTLAIGGK